jgi:hypothetical protein
MLGSRSKRLAVAGTLAATMLLGGLTVAGALGGVTSTPGPDSHSEPHPASQSDLATLPDPALDGKANAGDLAGAASLDVTATNVPAAGEAPSGASLSTAMEHTEGTPGNAVLDTLVNTPPGSERGMAIADNAQTLGQAERDAHAVPPPTPDSAQDGLSHKP